MFLWRVVILEMVTHSPRRSWLTRLDDTDFGAKVDFCRRRKTGEPSEADWDQPITALVRILDRTRVVVMTTDRVVRSTSFVDWIQFHTRTKHAGSMHQKHVSDCVITECMCVDMEGEWCSDRGAGRIWDVCFVLIFGQSLTFSGVSGQASVWGQ